MWPKNIIHNVKPLSALDRTQEKDSLFVYFKFCVDFFYRCCTEHSVTSDTSSWAKHKILNQRGEIVIKGEKKERIWILYVTHLPFLFSDVADKESQRITEDLSVRKATM